MRKFSRWMPPAAPAKTSLTLTGCLFLVVLASGAIAALVASPVAVGLSFGIWVLVIIIGTCVIDCRLRQLAAERKGEDIGTFARSFNRRLEPFDPWVVRATWDALLPSVTFRGGHLPLRRTDRLTDLPIDPDDLYPELIAEIAARSGHSLDQPESNPYYRHVDSVGDLVKFITYQPRIAGR